MNKKHNNAKLMNKSYKIMKNNIKSYQIIHNYTNITINHTKNNTNNICKIIQNHKTKAKAINYITSHTKVMQQAYEISYKIVS